ncbi:MAG: penicillin-binding protein 2 [bacterium]|nr:penicillin-binding protein 2 [bacterium]
MIKRKGDRFFLLFLFVFVVFTALFLRLGYLQILQSAKYTSLAENQRTRTSDLLPRRGSILLSEKDGVEPFSVATTRQAESAYVEPRVIKNLDYTVGILSEILMRYDQREVARREKLLDDSGQNTLGEIETRNKDRKILIGEEKLKQDEQAKQDIQNRLRNKLSNPKDPYEPLIASYQRFDDQLIQDLKNLNLPEIRFEKFYDRYYPEETLAAQVLGYVRQEGIGIKGEYGIEGAMNDVLQGRSGFMASERDVIGRLISVSSMDLKPAEDGADIVLTIDRIVQTYAESVAKQGRDKFSAEKASIIVADPYTGEIKAIANYPTFDPNYFGDVRDISVMRNNAILDVFEPGSIFKPLIMSIAIDLGLVTPNTTMNDAGALKVGKYIINTFNGKHLGVITMTQILEQSNNVGMVWVAQKIGAEKLFEGLRHFGIGDKTGLPLTGEAARALPLPDTWSEVKLDTISFGQGVVVTPMQMLVSAMAVINGGQLLEPHIIKEIRYSNGNVDKTQVKLIRQVVSPESATKVSAMMTSVVENGVGALAKVKGYYVGGKTGTAQVVESETGRYSADKKIISFFGFAPADKPKFAVLIILDNPKGLSFASGTAAPMFHDLASKLLNYYMVPPTR